MLLLIAPADWKDTLLRHDRAQVRTVRACLCWFWTACGCACMVGMDVCALCCRQCTSALLCCSSSSGWVGLYSMSDSTACAAHILCCCWLGTSAGSMLCCCAPKQPCSPSFFLLFCCTVPAALHCRCLWIMLLAPGAAAFYLLQQPQVVQYAQQAAGRQQPWQGITASLTNSSGTQDTTAPAWLSCQATRQQPAPMCTCCDDVGGGALG